MERRLHNPEIDMNCLICKRGNAVAGTATVTLQRDRSTVIIRDVPADVCDNCDEYYLTEEVTGDLLERAERAVASGAEVEILRYAACWRATSGASGCCRGLSW